MELPTHLVPKLGVDDQLLLPRLEDVHGHAAPVGVVKLRLSARDVQVLHEVDATRPQARPQLLEANLRVRLSHPYCGASDCVVRQGLGLGWRRVRLR